jgi:hypothetical protein
MTGVGFMHPRIVGATIGIRFATSEIGAEI